MWRLRPIPTLNQLSAREGIGLPIGVISVLKSPPDVVVTRPADIIRLSTQIAKMVSLINPAVDLNQKEEDPYGRKINQQKRHEIILTRLRISP